MSNQIFNDILSWSAETFPKRSREDDNPTGLITHLDQEYIELVQSGYTDVEEMADVCFLLIQLAEARGASLDEALRAKLEKNKSRVWPKEPDENGVYNHVGG